MNKFLVIVASVFLTTSAFAYSAAVPCFISKICQDNVALYVLTAGNQIEASYNVDAGQTVCQVTPNTTVIRLARQRLVEQGKKLQLQGVCSSVTNIIH